MSKLLITTFLILLLRIEKACQVILSECFDYSLKILPLVVAIYFDNQNLTCFFRCLTVSICQFQFIAFEFNDFQLIFLREIIYVLPKFCSHCREKDVCQIFTVLIIWQNTPAKLFQQSIVRKMFTFCIHVRKTSHNKRLKKLKCDYMK